MENYHSAQMGKTETRRLSCLRPGSKSIFEPGIVIFSVSPVPWHNATSLSMLLVSCVSGRNKTVPQYYECHRTRPSSLRGRSLGYAPRTPSFSYIQFIYKLLMSSTLNLYVFAYLIQFLTKAEVYTV